MSATLEKYQWWVFITTFVNYAFAHWTRKCYTNVTAQLMESGVTKETLAAMASGFMFTYSAGSFVTGMLGDRYSPVTIIGIGLLGSSVVLLLIIIGASPAIATSDAALFWFAGVQILHGFFQATGGPVNTAIMNNWWPKEGRGKVFGFWTCHQYVGDIVAAFAGGLILSSSLNWRYAIIIPMTLNGAWSFVNFTCVPSEKTDVPALAEEARLIPKTDAEKAKPKDDRDGKPLGILEAFAIPNVLGYALAFGFFKLINYAMFFQLPMILNANFEPATASLISSLYSFGMMPGGVICGWMSDIYGGRRACVCATMMVALIPLLLLFAYDMDNLPIGLLLGGLCVMGCLVGGPNNIITSAVAADLADQVGGKATGTIVGLINGSGSCTAAFGQLLIPVLAAHGAANDVGYRYVWLFLVVCTILGTLLLGPKIMKELAPVQTASTTIGYQAVELKTTKMAV